MTTTGRVVRFDEVRGYGFIAPDGGGEDVFLHANDLEIGKSEIRRNARVLFDIEQGERGKFATKVRLHSVQEASPDSMEHGVADSAYDEYFDSITQAEFSHVVTEVLLHVAPALTGEQIIQVREALRSVADRHGWVDAN